MAIEIRRQDIDSTSVEGLFACARTCLFEIMLREGGFDEFVKNRLHFINKDSSESEVQEMIACVGSLSPSYELDNGAVVKIELARKAEENDGNDDREEDDALDM